jgi:hypothetical protein
MNVYAMVGNGLLEIGPEEWSDEVAEVAIRQDEAAVVIVEELETV